MPRRGAARRVAPGADGLVPDHASPDRRRRAGRRRRVAGIVGLVPGATCRGLGPGVRPGARRASPSGSSCASRSRSSGHFRRSIESVLRLKRGARGSQARGAALFTRPSRGARRGARVWSPRGHAQRRRTDRVAPGAPAQHARGRSTATPAPRSSPSAGRLFAERGVSGTTMAEIARRSGLQQSSLYYYFRNKEQVLEAIVVEANRAPLALVEQVRRDGGPAVGAALPDHPRRRGGLVVHCPTTSTRSTASPAATPTTFHRYWAERGAARSTR